MRVRRQSIEERSAHTSAGADLPWRTLTKAVYRLCPEPAAKTDPGGG
jgi:hypothetical protein